MKLLPLDEMTQWEIDALIVENPLDIQYLTGKVLSQGFLIVNHLKSTLFVDGRYIEEAKMAILISDDSIKSFLTSTSYRRIGFDEDSTTFSRYLYLKSLLTPLNIELVALKSPIKKLRAVKTQDEILKLKSAAKLNKKGFDFVKSCLREGVKEKEVAKQLKIFWLQEEGSEPSFEPIIAFGKNSSKPHYRAGNTSLKKNDIALVDIGVSKDGWQSDATQTFIFGKPDPLLLKIYDVVQEALEKTLNLCKAGTLIGLLDREARNIIKNAGFEKEFKHSVGHGIGLQVHEYPILKADSDWSNKPLKEGMCITIEPGIYLEDIGGVRLEKSIIINQNGYEVLC